MLARFVALFINAEAHRRNQATPLIEWLKQHGGHPAKEIDKWFDIMDWNADCRHLALAFQPSQ
jgi:hypothetical protein